ncbi:peptidoglycan-binding protein [Rhodanobacter sp. 7MK24]|uniref:peptidoglycan-binding domain-containing protein n=1 Tax=Rhodanobacter sp. 7MK24 TaxID=2775922 RepID=UPI0017819228|nr:peptidoglycan-binding domain-containing protein [Rhodanobacter sp. 7MK24]MBD8882433.1 peptidoglycan-binding protein [Rhodanobacter sp. 7MK24]
MPDNTSITRDQLSTLFWGAELGGDAKLANHFSYAEKGQSTYSFGVPQFDVGNDDHAQRFLKENGFSAHDVQDLSKQGGLSRTELNTLDAKLQAIPQAKIDQFTDQHLDRLIGNVDTAIDQVRKQNPAAADAIGKDPKLQLSIADYENQFGSVGPQLVGFLAGKPEKLPGGTVQAGNPPTRNDLVNFVHNTKYGQDPHNAKAVESRNERFDEAMATLKLSPATKAANHTSDKATSTLEQGAHGQAVHDLQTKLAGLGYLDAKGVDGDFGIHTRHAVERFQHDHHLTVDGKAGPLTQQAMHSALRQHATTHGLSEPKKTDHALFEQALAGVRTLDAHGRPTDQQRLNLAASLAAEAKQLGMTRIDQVALGDNGSRVCIAQHPTSPMEMAKFGSVDTVAALQTPMAQSSAMAASTPTPNIAPQAPVIQPSAPTQTLAL